MPRDPTPSFLPIVTWDIYAPFSTPRGARLKYNGGIYLIQHLAGHLSDSPVREEADILRFRVLLAELLAPLSAGESYNYFGTGQA